MGNGDAPDVIHHHTSGVCGDGVGRNKYKAQQQVVTQKITVRYRLLLQVNNVDRVKNNSQSRSRTPRTVNRIVVVIKTWYYNSQY